MVVTIAIAGSEGEAQATSGVCSGGHFHVYISVNGAEIAIAMEPTQLAQALLVCLQALNEAAEPEEGEDETPRADPVDPSHVAPEHRHLLN